jgi:two-component system, cell cycle sensor histidine kinase and response regulator CckA
VNAPVKALSQHADAKGQAAPYAPYQLFGLLVLAIVAAVAGTYRYHESQKQAIEREVRNQLVAIADMKVAQLSEWRQERIGDGEAVMADSMSNAAIRRLLAGPARAADRVRILAWMDAFCKRVPYADAILADSSGRIALSAGRRLGDEEHLRQIVKDVIASGRITLRDFHRDTPNGPIHLGLIVPLKVAAGAAPFGVMLFGIDPADHLYPLLGKWPIPSASGETLLVRQDGDQVLYLNDLRHRTGAAMSLRVPLTGGTLPAAKAISGGEGNAEGVDYRGVPVFAALRRVPDSPWFLVAKVDAEEVSRPIARRSVVGGVAALGFVLAVAAGVAFLWRRQQLRFYRDRYRAELERRALAGHYDYLSRFANDIILLADEDKRIVEANDRAVCAYGYTREELVGMDIRDLRHPSGRDEFERQWRRTEERGSAVFETVQQRRDGTPIPVEVSSRRVEVEGRVFRQSIIRDITERRAMDEKLRGAVQTLEESESRFRATFEQAAVGMAHLGLDGRFLRVNERLCAIGGYSRDEMLGLTARDVTPSADLDREEPLLRKLVAGELDCVALEKRFRKKDGSEVWVYATTSVLHSASGEPLHLVSVVEDITQRRGAQSALLQSEERFRQVVESAPEGIVVEAQCIILYLNPVAVRLLGGESAGQLLGRCMLDLIHPDERSAAMDRSAMVARGSPAPLAERRYIRLDGSILPAEVSAAPIVYDQRPSSLIFFRDIGVRKRIEAERAVLEHQLRQAQKMESMGRLAGGVAHDFNNHLTVINGYCDMLLGQLHPEDSLREPLDEIRTAGERASALTRQLLAFSRKEMTEMGPVCLKEVVADAGRMLRRLIGEDVAIVTRHDPAPAVVMADRGQMNQVLVNLAVNARDAMPDGGTLVIETSSAQIGEPDAALDPDARPGCFVVLAVSDTGAGMSLETQQKIFEPFFTTKNFGTGLGLATVYGIVRQNGGWIRVHSEVGKGARFEIFLPLIEGDAPALAKDECCAARRGSETVLVVEDQPEVRRLTMVILDRIGYRLLEAANGAEALEVLQRDSQPIDLMITDVVMPGMNGRELAMRAAELRPSLKVLYISGYTADAIGRQGVLDPGVAYLPKPFTATQLSAKIRELLEV